MSKSRKKITSLVVAVMYALCILVAAPVQAYAYVPDTHAVAKKYTKAQKAAQTTKALKALAKLPTSTTSAKAYDNAYEYTLLVSRYNDAANQVLRAKNMGVSYKGLKNYARLAIAKARINVLRAVIKTITPVIALINALPDVITLADTAQVNAANDAFNDLTAAEQKLVSNKGALTEAVADLAALNNPDAAAVVALIAALPVPVTLANEAAVVAARTDYTALTATDKLLVTNLAVLVTAEAKIVELNGVLTIESVTAVNARQIKITFNKDVDETAAETLSNYDVFRSSALTTDVLTTTGTAVATGKEVLLTIDTAAGSFSNYSTTNKVVVYKAVGLAADYTNAAVALTDVTIPTLLSVQATGSKELTLQFSEPLNKALGAPTNVTLNAGTIGLNLAAATYNDADAQLVISTFANLTAGTTYTVAIAAGTNLADYVGFGVTPKTVTFTYAPVTVAPTATLTKSTETTATLEFSNSIDVATLVNNANVLFTHTYNNTTNQVTGTAVTNPSGDKKTFVITFANAFPPGASSMWMKYTSALGTLITDNYGNVAAAASFTVTTVADTTLPTVTAAMATSSNTVIEVTYSEPVTGAMTAANYVLKKGTTTIALAGAPTLISGNKYSVVSGSALSGDYTLTISGIKDTSIAANTIVATTLNIHVNDIIAPNITDNDNTTAGVKFYTQTVDGTKVKIFFSEAMNPADLTDLTKYQNTSAANANPTLAVASADAKSVVLTFAANPTANIVVGTIRDAAGNAMVGFSKTLNVEIALAEVSFNAITTEVADPMVATSTTTVKVYLDDVVSGVTIADFEIRKNAIDWVNPSSYSIDNSTGKSVITFFITTGNAFTMDAANVLVRTVSAPLVQGTTVNGTNMYGVGINFLQHVVADYMAPTVKSFTYLSPTKMEIVFNENLDNNTIALAGLNGFSVTGGTLTSALIGTANDVVILTGSSFTADTDIMYNGATGITDVAGNSLAAFSKTVTLEIGAITVVNAAANNDFTITTNFVTTIAAAGDVDMDAAAGVQAATTINGVVYTVTAPAGLVTITAVGNSTATLAATTATFTITKGTVVKTVTMGIPAATATTPGAAVTVAAQ